MLEKLKNLDQANFNSNLFLKAITSDYYYICDDVFTKEASNKILLLAKASYHDRQFHKARIGKQINKKLRQDIRGDSIAWIDDWHESLKPVYDFYTDILNLCRKELFLPIKRFESHFSYYPPESFYLRHCDKHKTNPHRILTAVFYLSDWQEGYGGELVIYDENAKAISIKPKLGRLVIFDSAMEHEVKITYKDRWTLTTWFRDDILPII